MRGRWLTAADRAVYGLPPDFGGRAAASTAAAVLFELSRCGIARLRRSRTQTRIAELSHDQMASLITTLCRMRPKYPPITAELIQLLREVPK